jgi:hypothetical protein
VALGSTWLLTEMSTRGNGGQCIDLITLPPSWVDFLKIWELNLLEREGRVEACNGFALHDVYMEDYRRNQDLD